MERKMHLNGTFQFYQKRCKLSLSPAGISYEKEGKKKSSESFAINEIVSCWLCPKGSLKCSEFRTTPHSPGVSPQCTCKHWGQGKNGIGFSIEVCKKVEGTPKWTTKIIPFTHPASDVVFAWHLGVWNQISELKNRPRNLLLVINPYGGRRKALSICKRKLVPFLVRSGIRYTTIQTEYRGHATRLMCQHLSPDLITKPPHVLSSPTLNQNNLEEVYQPTNTTDMLEGVDGVLAIGGDGLVSELVKGMIIAESCRLGVDYNDPQTLLPSTPVRLGIIPGGSTDATCHATHGTSDLVTSILHIIMGDEKPIDIAGLYSNGKLEGIATSMSSWGFFADLMVMSERLRNLGPTRYFLSGIYNVLFNKSYNITVKIKQPLGDTPNPMLDASYCSDGCVICSKSGMLSNIPCESSEKWVEFQGRYQVISATVTNCSSRLNKYGLSPSAHIGDGNTDVILVEGNSRFKLLSYLVNTCKGNATNLNHVTIIRGKEIHFTANSIIESNNAFWSCDGELIAGSNAIIKSHCQRLKLFSRGVEVKPG